MPRVRSPAKSQTALLSKEEGLRRIDVWDGRGFAFCEVGRFLGECDECRVAQRPPLSSIVWKNRPKWDGEIIDLAPVVGGPPIALARC